MRRRNAMRLMRWLPVGLALAFFGVGVPAGQAAPASVLNRALHAGGRQHLTTARGVPGLTPHAIKAMIGQVPLDRARAQLEAAAMALPQSAADGLSGTWVSGATHVLTVYWKGAVQRSVRQLLARLSSPIVRVKVTSARYTLAYLNARVAKLIKIAGVQAIGIRPDGSGLIVWLDPAARAGFLLATSALHGVPLQVRYGRFEIHAQHAVAIPSALPTSGRLADHAPHWAGARVEGCQPFGVSTECSDCTSGFPLRRNSD